MFSSLASSSSLSARRRGHVAAGHERKEADEKLTREAMASNLVWTWTKALREMYGWYDAWIMKEYESKTLSMKDEAQMIATSILKHGKGKYTPLGTLVHLMSNTEDTRRTVEDEMASVKLAELWKQYKKTFYHEAPDYFAESSHKEPSFHQAFFSNITIDNCFALGEWKKRMIDRRVGSKFEVIERLQALLPDKIEEHSSDEDGEGASVLGKRKNRDGKQESRANSAAASAASSILPATVNVLRIQDQLQMLKELDRGILKWVESTQDSIERNKLIAGKCDTFRDQVTMPLAVTLHNIKAVIQRCSRDEGQENLFGSGNYESVIQSTIIEYMKQVKLKLIGADGSSPLPVARVQELLEGLYQRMVAEKDNMGKQLAEEETEREYSEVVKKHAFRLFSWSWTSSVVHLLSQFEAVVEAVLSHLNPKGSQAEMQLQEMVKALKEQLLVHIEEGKDSELFRDEHLVTDIKTQFLQKRAKFQSKSRIMDSLEYQDSFLRLQLTSLKDKQSVSELSTLIDAQIAKVGTQGLTEAYFEHSRSQLKKEELWIGQVGLRMVTGGGNTVLQQLNLYEEQLGELITRAHDVEMATRRKLVTVNAFPWDEACSKVAVVDLQFEPKFFADVFESLEDIWTQLKKEIETMRPAVQEQQTELMRDLIRTADAYFKLSKKERGKPKPLWSAVEAMWLLATPDYIVPRGKVVAERIEEKEEERKHDDAIEIE